MQLFFADNIESDFYVFPQEESRHIVRVLRMRVGDAIHLTDGNGTLLTARIVDDNPKGCGVEVTERIENYGRRPFRLEMAVAPTKNSARIEWFVEKAVEMGIDVITPIVCDHSERCVIKTERLDKIVVSAMKQSLKTFRPSIEPPTPMRELIAQPFDGQRFIAYCDDDTRIPLRDLYRSGNNAQILIGPEGDFSPEEVRLALDNGFSPVTLGNCRLRTETAAVAAVAFFNLCN